MKKSIRFSAVYLAIAVLLSSVLILIPAVTTVSAQDAGMVGDWKGSDRTVFYIGGDPYTVETDESYTGKYVTYNDTKYYLIQNAADFNKVKYETATATTVYAVNAIIANDFTFTNRTGPTNCYALNLEGCGHTITFGDGCTRPLYNNFSGRVNNLKLAGNITLENAHIGVVCIWWKGGTLSNIETSVNVTLTGDNSGSNYYVGPLAGRADTALFGSTHTAINCSNSGNFVITESGLYCGLIGAANGTNLTISYCSNGGTFTDYKGNTTSNSGNTGIGGMIGYIYGAGANISIDHCENNCAITTGTSSTGRWCGGIVGRIFQGTLSISECTNEATLTSGGDGLGGIVGFVHQSATKVTITNSTNNGTIAQVGTQNTAGIVGKGSKAITITGCTNTGSVTSKGSSAGGVIGYWDSNGPTITNCVNRGKITNTSAAGGIAGKISACNATIRGCVNYGDVTSGSNGENSAGGIVACVRTSSNKNNTFTVDSCTNYGTVTGTNTASYIGGIVSNVSATKTTESNFTITLNITNCVNNGTLLLTNAKTAWAYLGGIFASPATWNLWDNCTINLNVKGCVNTGTLQNQSASPANPGGYGGIVACTGNVRTDGEKTYVLNLVIDGCVNSGSISDGYSGGNNANVAGILGRATIGEGYTATVSNCISIGQLTPATTASEVYGIAQNEGADGTVTVSDCAYLAFDESYTAAAATYKATESNISVFAAKDLASGKVAYEINRVLTAAEASFRYSQNLDNGETPDDAPVAGTESGAVYAVALKAGETTIGTVYSNTDAAADVSLSTTVALRESPAGMRWVTVIDAYQLDVILAYAEENSLTVSYGTLISPSVFANAAGGLTKANLLTWLAGFEKDDLSMVSFDVVAEDWYCGVAGQFAGSLVNIKEANENLAYSGIGYLTIGDITVYSDHAVTAVSSDLIA